MYERYRRLRASLLALLGIVILLGEIMVSYRGRTDASAASAGPTWHLLGLPAATVHAVALSPVRSDIIYVATESGIYRRGANGRWKQILNGHAIWSLAVLPDGRTVLAADQNGTVDISPDSGAHWQYHFLNGDGVFALSVRPGDPTTVLAGAGAGLYLSRDTGRHWHRQVVLRQSAGAAFAWLPGSTHVVFGGAVASGAQGDTEVFISRDAGGTWHLYGHGLQSAGGIMSLGVSATGQVLAGTMGHATWSASGGAWEQVAAGMPTTNNHVAAITVIPGNPQQIVIATLALGVFRSSNGGRTWINLSRGLPAVGHDKIVLSLAYDADRSTLYAGTFHGLYSIPLREHL